MLIPVDKKFEKTLSLYLDSDARKEEIVNYDLTIGKNLSCNDAKYFKLRDVQLGTGNELFCYKVDGNCSNLNASAISCVLIHF